jgi:quercetin dioxygenase-like cupin family protein
MPPILRSAIAAVAVMFVAAPALAEEAQADFKRTPLQAADFPEGYKTVSAIAEIAPGGATGMHTHPGIETGYVIEGEAVMSIEGQPDRTVKAGDSYLIPAGANHNVVSTGSVNTKAISVFVVDASQPLASPAK